MSSTLTGLQPSADFHIGNYFGAIEPILRSQASLKDSDKLFLFVANYHAMTSLQSPKLRENSLKAAAAFLALGIDPKKCIFYLQSDLSEVFELAWILAQFCPTGLLERAHAFKDKTAKGLSSSLGLFSYPVLMAADILICGAKYVPVGKDQVQHVEIARDLAQKVNAHIGKDLLTLPEAVINDELATLPGVDGAKMSKSYKNTIDIFMDAKKRQKQINGIKTDSKGLDEKKDPDTCHIFAIAKPFLDLAGQEALRRRYEAGAEGYGHFKLYLGELMEEKFGPAYKRYCELLENEEEIISALDLGAKRVRDMALPLMDELREHFGIGLKR